MSELEKVINDFLKSISRELGEMKEVKSEEIKASKNKRILKEEWDKLLRHATPETHAVMFFEDDYKHPEVDLVLVPMSNTVYVRGRRSFRKIFDRGFTGGHRYAQALAYIEGLAKMYEAQQEATRMQKNSDEVMLTVVSIRVD